MFFFVKQLNEKKPKPKMPKRINTMVSVVFYFQVTNDTNTIYRL